jgi:diguanylate cyclase (GGDEF)-like protein
LRGRLLLGLPLLVALPFVLLRLLPPANWPLAAALSLAAAILLALYFIRRAARRLQKLQQAARSLEAGDFESGHLLPLDGDMGDLVEVVDSMVQAVSTQTARVAQRSKELQALVNLSGAFLESMDLRITLETALQEAVAATHAEAGAAFMVLPGGTQFETMAALNIPKEQVGLRYPIDAHSAPGYAMMVRKTIACADLNKETRFHVPPAVLKLGVVSLLTAPMLIDGRVVGALTLDAFTTHEFSPGETSAVQAIANHSAVALERIKLVKDLSESYDRILSALVAALDTRDHETEGHSQRVVAYSLALAESFQLNADAHQEIERGARLHDIGKIGVPDAILHKTSKLNEAEWAIVRNHPAWGKQILEGIGFLSGAAEIVLAHHERWDGQGYPRGLKGEQIPLGARIFAVADAFDAMTSYRPYRDPHTYQKARDEIRMGSGNQFDPQVVTAFLAIGRDQWIHLREESGGARQEGAEPKELGSLRRISSGQLQAMNAIIAAITSSLDFKEVMQQCVKSLTTVTRAAGAAIYLLNAPKDELSFAAAAGLHEGLTSQADAKSLNQLLDIEKIKASITQFQPNVQEMAHGSLLNGQPQWASLLVLPLQEGEKEVGALALFSAAPHVFDDDERTLFDHVANQLGLAMANAHAHEKVRVQAITDALTGAYNRHYLDDFLNIEVKRCQRYKRPLAMVMLDMDHFKACNEASGHQGGDKALQDAVQLLNLGVRSVDLVARYGGEEFLVVLPETDAEGALEAAERLRRLIEKHRFPCGNLTASLGVAASSYADGDAPSVEEMIRRADKALYKAKQDGRNKTRLWDAELIEGTSN